VEFKCDVPGVYGDRWIDYLKGAPGSAFVADGSQVLVRRGVRLGPDD